MRVRRTTPSTLGHDGRTVPPGGYEAGGPAKFTVKKIWPLQSEAAPTPVIVHSPSRMFARCGGLASIACIASAGVGAIAMFWAPERPCAHAIEPLLLLCANLPPRAISRLFLRPARTRIAS